MLLKNVSHLPGNAHCCGLPVHSAIRSGSAKLLDFACATYDSGLDHYDYYLQCEAACNGDMQCKRDCSQGFNMMNYLAQFIA